MYVVYGEYYAFLYFYIVFIFFFCSLGGFLFGGNSGVCTLPRGYIKLVTCVGV